MKWELTDHQGSVRLFVDAAGTATDRYDYTPFGEYLGAGVGTRTTTQGYSGAQLRQRFAGTTRDYTMTGLEDTPWRKMDSKAGRWTTPDPYNGSMSVGDPQSFNRYAYVGNDPVNFTDPSGLYWAIDLGSCRSEVVSDGEGGIRFSGREICNLRWVDDSPRGEPREGGGGGGATAPQTGQPQLGPCNLSAPSFNDLSDTAVGLLSGPFDDDPRALYNSLSTYNQAVFANTVAALADARVNLSNANFTGFYRSTKPGNSTAYGIEVTGVGRSNLGTLERGLFTGTRSPDSVKVGSVEATFERGGIIAFDVDLFNPRSNARKHLGEVRYNSRNNTTTHPGDVARQLASRGVNSGVGCQ